MRFPEPRGEAPWVVVYAPDVGKLLILLLGIGFFLAEPPRCLAQREDLTSLAQQIKKLYQEGRYKEAIPFAEKLLAIKKGTLGPDQPETAASLNDLAALYEAMGAYEKAEPLFQQALQIFEKAFGPDNPNTATSLNNLALVYFQMGAYAKAEPLFQQTLQIFEKALGPDHPDTATSLNNLAELYRATGAYEKAEPLYQQALQIYQKAFGLDHSKTAMSLNNLAELYRAMGAYEKAEPLYQQALQIRKNVLGRDHPDTGTSLNNLAELYRVMGAYEKAEPLYQQALQIKKDVLGPDHPDIGTILNNLALLYFQMGAYEKAEPLFQQALQICQKALGPDHPYTASSLNNLAELYRVMGAYAKAEPLYQQALQICQKALGPDHPDVAESVNNLAAFYFKMGAYAKAEPLYRRALQISQQALGPDHPDIAAILNNLAFLYFRMGTYEKAEPLFQQALEVDKRAFGLEHHDTVQRLKNLAELKFDLGQVLEAKALEQQSAQAGLAILAKILAFTSEQQRLAYQATLYPYALFAVLEGSEAELASAVLRYKGVVLDSIIEDRLVTETSKTSEDRDLLTRLGADKRQLGQLLLQTRDQPSGDINKIEALEHEVEQIDKRFAQHVSGLGGARRALIVTVEQVQAAIPQDGALIEYLRYDHYMGKGQFELRYGAVVLAAAGPPRWIALENAKDVDTLVNQYQRSVRDVSDETLSANLEELYRKVWIPIERALAVDVKRVIISPDSQLNFVSFATLLDTEERFLAEKYSVQYVASGRDLLRELKPSTAKEAVLFANPAFHLASTAMLAKAEDRSSDGASKPIRGNEKKEIEDWSFGSLEGTQKERDELIKKFAGWGWTPTDFTAKEATKEALLKIHSPYILHLATHGFFAKEDPNTTQTEPEALLNVRQSVTRSKFFKNPMHRSGLALAGAQTTIEAWKREEVPPLENDGILTAEDVSTLDLQGTWLVTLSACDTGSGEARAGEGVMGLRRGFIQAGAQNLLMTLWSISDEVTVQIMSDFYEAAHQSSNAPEALAKVQRSWLVKLRKEQGLASAVNLAGPFIMSSQGRPVDRESQYYLRPRGACFFVWPGLNGGSRHVDETPIAAGNVTDAVTISPASNSSVHINALR
jgi:tetratricopeptide (TPR) repeat protein/CHAT domain-containing protein